MKVVASVQAKKSSSRGILHYIAHSKIDGEKEPKGRQIFNEYANHLEVEKANDLLKNGISHKRLANEELLHLVISLKNEDFEQLGQDEKGRQKSLQGIIRYSMKEFEKEIDADSLNWAAGIHRNTDHPHVHIAINKEYFDQELEKKHLTKIPLSLLPHYEKTNTGERIFVEGILIKSATEKLDEILREKEKSRLPSPNKVIDGKSPNQPLLKPETTAKEMAESNSKNKNERDILARAILARYYLDRSRGIVLSLENHGANRRFKFFDELTGKFRKMSLSDLERRAEKNADQFIKQQNLKDLKAGEELKKKLVTEELSKNEAGIKRIKTILHNLIRKENHNLRTRENEYKSVKPLAEKIKQSYRRQNKKLPIPNLSAEDLEMLQTHALENKDFRVAAYFERVRQEKSVEDGTSSRTEAEISRLKANRKVTDLRIKFKEQQLTDFQTQKRILSIEVNGKKFTLLELDSLIVRHHKQEKKITGKVVKVLGRMGLIESKETLKFLNETRVILNRKLNEKSYILEKTLADEKKLLKTLDEFYKNENHPDKEKIVEKFSAAELSEIESLALTLKLSDVYQDNWNQQKQMIETPYGNAQHNYNEQQKRQNLVTGRALAREILAEIEVNRALDELTKFKKYHAFQKFEVKDDQTGKSKFVSLSEVGLNQKGSVLDQTLEYFLESREVRKMRQNVEKQIKEKQIELKENVKAANSLLNIARDATAEFKTNYFFGKNDAPHVPLFTPKELINIELRMIQTSDKTEAKNLQQILDSVDPSQAGNLSAMLQDIGKNNESDKNLSQSSPNERKSELEVEKVDHRSQQKALPSQEKKVDMFEPDRGR